MTSVTPIPQPFAASRGQDVQEGVPRGCAATPLPAPSWATRTVAEDGGFTHETVCPTRPVRRMWTGQGSTLASCEVSLSTVDVPADGRWSRQPVTIQVEGGAYPLAGARLLRQALDQLLQAAGEPDPSGGGPMSAHPADPTTSTVGLPSPSAGLLVRRRLGRRLKALRLAAGKTHADAETAGMGHRSTLWRIEDGRTPVRPATVRALCWLYRADDAVTDTLYAMACHGDRPGWSEPLTPTPAEASAWPDADTGGLAVDLQAEAAGVAAFHPDLVGGFLRTDEYVRAVLAATVPRPAPQDIEQSVAAHRELVARTCLAPGLMETVKPGRATSNGRAEEVPRRAA